MAQYDGTITLYTNVDTTGIKSSKSEIKSAANKIGVGFRDLGETIAKAMDTGSAKTVQLANNTRKATVDVEKQIAKVEELKAHLAGVESGEIQISDKGVSKLQSDFDKTNATIQKTKAEINQLAGDLTALQDNATKIPGTGDIAFAVSEQTEFDKISAKLDELEPRLDANKQKAFEMGEALKNATGAATQAEIEKTKLKLSGAESKLQDLQIKAEIAGQKLQNEMSKSNQAVSAVGSGLGNMGTKLLRLAKGALVFSVITKGFMMLRQGVGSALMSNEAFRQSIMRLQSAFWVAFTPIYNYVLPALQALINGLTKVIMMIVQVYSTLTGKSMSTMIGNAKALQQQSDAYKAVGAGGSKAAKGMKEATNAAKKQIATFDELNILTEDKANADSGGGAAGGGGAAAGGMTFEGLEEMDTTQLDEFSEKLKGIAVIVGSIGLGLFAWKISEMMIGDMTKFLGQLQTLVGSLMIIAGVFLLVKGYSDAWVNGIDWENFTLMMGGLALVIGGIALAVSPIAAAFAAIGGGIALLVLGVKDFIENGSTFQNILTVVIGLLVIFAATMFIAGAPIAIVVTAIAALVAIFVMLWNTNEGFRDFWIELWDTIKTTAVNIWENYLKPTLKAIGDFFKEIYDNYIKPTIDFMIDKITTLWNDHIKPFWEEHLKPALQEMGNKISELWENVIEPVIKWIGDLVKDLWDNFLKPFINFIVDIFCEDFRNTFDTIGDIFGTFFDTASEIIDSVKEVLTGIINFIIGVFTGDWKKAWDGIKSIFKGVVNGIITLFEGMINFVIDGVNGFLKKINSAVEKVGDLIGQNWDMGLNINHISIPRLARGAVVPQNREFLAVLGDNKNEPEIVSPLSTMEQAVENVLTKIGGTGEQTVIIEIDGREFGRAVVRLGNQETRRVGTKLVYG